MDSRAISGPWAGLGEDEGALQDGLDEIANAFGGPECVGGVEIFGGLDVAGEDFDVRGEGVLAGGAEVGVSGVGLLDKGAEQAGVVGQLAGEDGGAEVEVAEEAVDRDPGLVVRVRRRRRPRCICSQYWTAARARSSLVLKWWKKLPLVTPASWQMSSTVVAA